MKEETYERRKSDPSFQGGFDFSQRVPDIEQRFGEEAEEIAVEAIGLHAAALHHRADHPAHQNPVDGLGGRVEQPTEHVQET